MWSVIGGRLNFIQFPGTDTEPARCGPGIAQQLQNTYDQYLRHFESAYILTVKNRPPTGSPQQPIHQMNPNSLAIGNNATPGISGNSTEMPPNPPRPFPSQQLIAVAMRYTFVSAQDMRNQRVPEHVITFVERHRADLVKLCQQQAQLIAKRNAEQEQQNMGNGQGSLPSMHEQASVGLQPGMQRPPQPIGANSVVGMAGEGKMANGSFVAENVPAAIQYQLPTQDQIQRTMMVVNQIKQSFQQRSELLGICLVTPHAFLGIPAITPLQVPDEQRAEYNQALEQAYKMTVELDAKLPLYFAFFRNDDLLRKYVAIVSFFVSLSWSNLAL